jgi:hypothetical protein
MGKETNLMPSSFVDSFPAIVKLLIDLEPQRVLDIGPGWGKYGLACREYLPDIEFLAGIEVPQGRLSTQDAIYDHVFIGDVRDASENLFEGYDVALLIDIIEHMTLDEGHQLLDAIQNAGCAVLVSTPKVFMEQHDESNPYETHISLWGWEDFAQHGVKADVSTIDSVIYLLKARR